MPHIMTMCDIVRINCVNLNKYSTLATSDTRTLRGVWVICQYTELGSEPLSTDTALKWTQR